MTVAYTYPDKLDLSVLKSEHETYRILAKTWQTIDDLIIGGHQIEAKKMRYITRRPDEDDGLYAMRLEKFVYTPVLGDSVKDYTTKVTNAPLHVLGAEGTRWETFRQRTDGKRRTEKELINKVFRSLIAYGSVWALVDREYLETVPRTRLEEETTAGLPYVRLFKPMDVINWELGNNDAVKWAKVQQVVSESTPFSDKPRYKAVWTIIDETTIARYSAYVKVDSTTGTITGLESEPTQPYSKNTEVPLESMVIHNYGKNPMLFGYLDPELWSCNAAFLKAKQHLNIENAWTDTATIAGYIQRVFKPTKQAPDNDPNFSYSEPDEDLERIKSSNAHLLIGDGFEFAEASGASLKVIAENVLDKIENQIKAIVSLGNVSASKDVVEQSGKSKQLDYTQLNDTMKRYGSILVAFYEELLSIVALALGENPDAVKVSGLDSFDVDVLNNLLSQTVQVQTFESKLPTLARKLWYTKVSDAMFSTLDSETKEQIRAEFETLNFDVADMPEKTESPSTQKTETAKPRSRQKPR